ncbi:sn-glycerol-3-phosphate ABC transporter ATP-binding protein UgpC [uncultured Ruegeria sp.]|uniref:ABC transporter ATP-binding protein n=1 Tax=uncultured Ruegeria sp. TaxID=259304 RepID=UPI00262692BD|nr:sn-glycerol-3-phosphate ABC transporter ATP-binding protein UgpC [uncultured Ruegeria sp.]
MTAFEAISLDKHYGDFHALRDINLSVEPGEFIVLVGPSGCGKSTLMRTIAGLEKVTSGDLKIDGRSVTGLLPKERDVAMVFQSYALYPHMTVAENIGFGMKIAKRPKDEIREKVLAAAKVLKIDDYLSRRPKALSGGQRQRVAIGRAIVRDPKIFLFDEPLSNLDAALRVEMRVELARLHNQLDATMIYVTHDQVEAMTLADRIVVMNAGVIEQVGSPLDLFNHPRNKFVAGFLGQPPAIFMRLDGHERTGDGLTVQFSGTSVDLPAPSRQGGMPFEIGLRPDFFELDSQSPSLSPTVEVIEQLGDTTLLYTRLPDGQQATVQLAGQVKAKVGDQVPLRVNCKSPMIFDDGGENIYR